MSAGHQVCSPPARSQPDNSPSPHLGHWKLSQHPIHETMHLSHCIDLAAHGSQAAKLPKYSNPNSSVCPFLISRFWISKNRSGFASLLSPRKQNQGPGVQQSNFLAQDLLTLRFPIDKPYRGIASLPQTVEGFAANITAIFDQQFFWNCSVNLDRTRATIS
jgi:hypothetical protein